MEEDIKALARELLEHGVVRLSERDRRVLARMASRRHVAHDPRTEYEAGMTLGQRAADQIARWGGSWVFVGGFGLFLLLWCAWNLLSGRAFDPYPFIFLNLLLSMLAAVQAPIIMMSQNRQAEIDRHQAGSDYEVNLKAEIEIMELHAKLDRMVERLP
ncbi:putative acid-resistant protein [Rubellimicrobium mesophilum DSM 19309]|uniref:Putative acid-resistant protein n=1 Tax=Rubellimicrobium mesophilum DSM 19309 TaxID=442562 RepID=A0A017HU31_9RHOB|nr:DUF1003 domain-containing protein [Rubellimicrobium mesophilum]EYD77845.1 putative acid-resistant protein [Rubellimicrobium mesophilum DSM 19309]